MYKTCNKINQGNISILWIIVLYFHNILQFYISEDILLQSFELQTVIMVVFIHNYILLAKIHIFY